jgi:hypothetical protein
MKTQLTLEILKEGTKNLHGGRLCIGALLFSNALKEKGVVGDPKVTWWDESGFCYNIELESYGGYNSYVDGKVKSLMTYGRDYYFTYIRLLFSTITVEFRKY